MQVQVLQRRNNVTLYGAILLALLIITFASAYRAHASATSGTIDTTHKYAFSNVGSWVNFGTANGGVTITDYVLSGYAWSANDGWINLAPAQSGVKNNGNGTLSGFAWDSSAGWVNFAGVTIDSSGLFHGLATGGTVNGANYAINFDCANCSVVTDWRPASSRPSSSGGGGCAPGFVWNPATITCVSAIGAISPIIITTVTPPSASSTVTTVTKVSSPSPAASGMSGKNPPSAGPATSGTAANGQGFVSNPSLTSTTTTFNTVSTSSAIHATTTAKKTAVSSFLGFLGSFWWSIFILAGVLAIFYFFAR